MFYVESNVDVENTQKMCIELKKYEKRTYGNLFGNVIVVSCLSFSTLIDLIVVKGTY